MVGTSSKDGITFFFLFSWETLLLILHHDIRCRKPLSIKNICNLKQNKAKRKPTFYDFFPTQVTLTDSSATCWSCTVYLQGVAVFEFLKIQIMGPTGGCTASVYAPMMPSGASAERAATSVLHCTNGSQTFVWDDFPLLLILLNTKHLRVW